MKVEGIATPPYEEMKGWFEKDPELFKPLPPPKEFNILVELRSHDHLVRLFDDRRRRLLVAGDNSGGFVTSDHPVCLRWADGQDHGETSPGFAVVGTEVIFPLSPKLAISGQFDGEDGVDQVDKDEVAGINTLLISNCHHQVYARDALFSYKRGPRCEIVSGAHLDTDEAFLASGNASAAKVVELRSK